MQWHTELFAALVPYVDTALLFCSTRALSKTGYFEFILQYLKTSPKYILTRFRGDTACDNMIAHVMDKVKRR